MFKLNPLPYNYGSLAPILSTETLEYHHGKHHRAYVEKLNELVEQKGIEAASLEELILHSTGEVYNNAAQVWNHDFYWASLSPSARKLPAGEFADALDGKFGSFADFKRDFGEQGLSLFGSGWVWLVMDGKKKIDIFCGSNADNPLRDGKT